MSVQPPQPQQPPRHDSINLASILNDPSQLETMRFSRPETAEDRTARITAQERKAKFELAIEGAVVVLVIIGVIIVFWYCVLILQNPAAGPDEKKWAQTILASVVSAGIGYLVGKK